MMRATIGLTLGALGTLALLTGLLTAGCGQLAQAADDLPVVTIYVTSGCIPCATAKRELAAAKKLPCRIVESLRAPAYVTLFPSFDWGPDDGKAELVGWPGLEEMLRRFKGTE